MNEQHDIYKIIKQTIDEVKLETDLDCDDHVHKISHLLTTRVNKHVNQLIEDIVTPCGVPYQS